MDEGTKKEKGRGHSGVRGRREGSVARTSIGEWGGDVRGGRGECVIASHLVSHLHAHAPAERGGDAHMHTQMGSGREGDEQGNVGRGRPGVAHRR
jgi:hypothetical protein